MWWSKNPPRAQPDWVFAEPEPPEQGDEQLPFVIRSTTRTLIFYIIFYSNLISNALFEFPSKPHFS